MKDSRKANAALVEALGSALREGDHGLKTVPALLGRVLREGSWREFVTQRGEPVVHDRFADFVATPPLKGLGASMELIDRIVGTEDPELLRLLREAKKAKPGPKTEKPSSDSEENYHGDRTDYIVDRLAREAPEEYAAVQRGEKTIHAAALDSGIRKRRISVRLDAPASAAATLRKHMPPDALRELVDLLNQE